MCGPQSLITICPFPEKNRQFQFQGIFEILEWAFEGGGVTWHDLRFNLLWGARWTYSAGGKSRSGIYHRGKRWWWSGVGGAALEQQDKDWIRDVTWRWSQQGSLTDWYDVEKTVKGKSYNCKLNYHVVVYLRREMHAMYFLIVFGSQMIFFSSRELKRKNDSFYGKWMQQT